MVDLVFTEPAGDFNDIQNTPTNDNVVASHKSDVPRDPDEAMLNGARDWSCSKYGIGVGNDDAIGCWQAMFDAFVPEDRNDQSRAGLFDVGDRIKALCNEIRVLLSEPPPGISEFDNTSRNFLHAQNRHCVSIKLTDGVALTASITFKDVDMNTTPWIDDVNRMIARSVKIQSILNRAADEIQAVVDET